VSPSSSQRPQTQHRKSRASQSRTLASCGDSAALGLACLRSLQPTVSTPWRRRLEYPLAFSSRVASGILTTSHGTGSFTVARAATRVVRGG